MKPLHEEGAGQLSCDKKAAGNANLEGQIARRDLSKLGWQIIESHNIGLQILCRPCVAKASCKTLSMRTVQQLFYQANFGPCGVMTQADRAPRARLLASFVTMLALRHWYECSEEVGFRKPVSKQGSWQEDEGYLMRTIHPGSLWLRLWE